MLPVLPVTASSSGFRDALARFATGVVVVATDGPAGPVGLTASAFSSVSLDPPLVLVCIAKSASAHAALVAGERFGVSVLHEQQAWIAKQVARSRPDRFEGVPLVASAEVPWVADALAHLMCVREAVHVAGDHSILLGRVLVAREQAGNPLVHYARAFGGFGGAERGA